MTESNLGTKKNYFILQLSGHTPLLREVKTGTQGRNLGAEIEVEVREEN